MNLCVFLVEEVKDNSPGKSIFECFFFVQSPLESNQ